MLATIGAGLLMASPAMAAPDPSYELTECDPGTVCLFDTKILGTDYHRYVVNQRPSGTCFNIPADWDNRTNVVYNRTSLSVTMYTGNICNGALAPYPILPGQRKGMGDNEEEANSILFQGGSNCLTEAPCFGNSHNRRS